MQLLALHLDQALRTQPEFLATLAARGAQEADLCALGALVRLWGKPESIAALQESIGDVIHTPLAERKDSEPVQNLLTFMGSGDFHHVTALLLELVLDRQPEPVTVIHFDNHPDWVSYTNHLHCGSWVNRAAAHPLVKKIITIGVTSNDLNLPESKKANLALLQTGKLELFPYAHAPSLVRGQYGAGAGYQQSGRRLHWQNIAEQAPEAFLATLLRRITTQHVYITVDKDVLHREDAITNWDQGGMRLPQLLAMLRAIGAAHRIIGADVNGDYSPPEYHGDLRMRLLKRAEILIDQPRGMPDAAQATAINTASNQALLAAFSEVMS